MLYVTPSVRQLDDAAATTFLPCANIEYEAMKDMPFTYASTHHGNTFKATSELHGINVMLQTSTNWKVRTQ